MANYQTASYNLTRNSDAARESYKRFWGQYPTERSKTAKTAKPGKAAAAGYTWADLKLDIQLLKREAERLEMAGKTARTPAEKLLLEAERKAAACSLEMIKWRHQRLKDGAK